MNNKIQKLLFVIFVAIWIDHSDAQNYCNIKSCGKQQTLCRFPKTGPSANCHILQGSGLTANERLRILNLHNRLRQKVASGNERRGSPGPQPAAKFMPNLQWDNEIAKVAQRWADQCSYGHDTCRNVARFHVGQNIAYNATTRNANTLNVEDSVYAWYNEVKDFSRYEVAKFSDRGANGNKIGHYTQLVWGNTRYLGCGATKYKKGQFNTLYLVCNYGPSGNWLGEPVYQAA